MALSSEMGAADVAAVVGNNRDNGYGLNGDGSFWIIVLFLFAFMNGGFNGYGNGGGMMPYIMNNSTNSDVQRGFDQSATMGMLNGINTGINNGFANAEVSRCNMLANLTNQMNGIAMAQQNCCCENRQATESLRYTIATENAADRESLSNGVRDIIANQTAGIQSIHDKLCQLELDAKDQKIADLQSDVNKLQLAASQVAQNGYFQNALNNAVQQLQPTPVPAYQVPNPNAFYGNFGCGCGNCA